MEGEGRLLQANGLEKRIPMRFKELEPRVVFIE